MASGLPLVVPAGGGTMELAHPDFAELWRAGDWRDGADAVRRVLARPRAPMAQAAVEAAARLGTPDEHFRRLFALYAELAARRRSAGEIGIAPEAPPLLGEGAPHPA
jgi:alpha-1,6-mannosyltransferase